MRMISSTIIDLWPIFRRWDISPNVTDGVRRLKLSRYGPSDLALSDGSLVMVVTRMFVHAIFIPTATSSTIVICALDSPTTSTRLFGCFSLEYWCWYLPMVIDYFNGCARVRRLGIATQIKIMGEPSWYFQIYDFVSIFGCLPEITRLCQGKRKSLKTSKIFLFLSYFIL
jgi:hypothetical protein